MPRFSTLYFQLNKKGNTKSVISDQSTVNSYQLLRIFHFSKKVTKVTLFMYTFRLLLFLLFC